MQQPPPYDFNNPQRANKLQKQFENMFIPIAPQAHTMPPPSAAPWNLELMPWALATTSAGDGVMEFKASKARVPLHHKRKSDLPIEPLPIKQYISEEKFTAHFNGLHISSDYIQSPASEDSASTSAVGSNSSKKTTGKCFTNLTYQDYQVTAKELEEKLKNANRISVCEELKKLHEEQNTTQFLPQVLVNRYEKPCTALVLWKPPSSLGIVKPTPNMKSSKFIPVSTKVEEYNAPTDFDTDDSFSEIDDFVDNNNTCGLDFNNAKSECMDEDM